VWKVSRIGLNFYMNTSQMRLAFRFTRGHDGGAMAERGSSIGAGMRHHRSLQNSTEGIDPSRELLCLDARLTSFEAVGVFVPGREQVGRISKSWSTGCDSGVRAPNKRVSGGGEPFI
jgi:hypothetical protein